MFKMLARQVLTCHLQVGLKRSFPISFMMIVCLFFLCLHRNGKRPYRRMVERCSQSLLLKEGEGATTLSLAGLINSDMYIFRHVARFCESYLRGVASKATTSIEQLLNTQITKFTDFEVVYYNIIMYRSAIAVGIDVAFHHVHCSWLYTGAAVTVPE